MEWRVRFLGRPRDAFLVPDRIVRVDPARIGRIARGDFAPAGRICPPVIAGDWDLTSTLTDGHGFYDDLRAVAAGAEWESTRVYRRAIDCFEAGKPFVTGVSDPDDLARALGRFERLLASMREHGYVSQATLAKLGPLAHDCVSPQEVTVAVGRDGSLLVRGGRHRVACATVLEVPEIPARVKFRHPDWMDVRRRIADYALDHGGTVPQPILHPDLDNIPAARACGVEFEQLNDVLHLSGGRLVDLSPRWGYFCHRFERVGLTCTAVCSRPEDEWFLRTLRDAEQRTFDIVAVDELAARGRFDVALALGWADGAPDGTAAARELLSLVSHIDAATLIVEVPGPIGGTSGEGSIDRRDGLLEALRHAGGFWARSHVLRADSRAEVYRLTRALMESEALLEPVACAVPHRRTM